MVRKIIMINHNNLQWLRILLFVAFTLSISSIYSITNTNNNNYTVNALTNQNSTQQSINTTIFDLQSKLFNSIFNQVENSVVQITSKIPQSSALNSTNPNNGQNVTALGSGFIYDTKGHVITNNHVIGNSKIVDVTFIDGNRYTAKVIAKDPFSDLAVLKIVENLTKPITPLKITNSSILKVGDPVIAIGNPYGLDNTMTTGIVSQTGRVISESSYSIPDAIQTDAPINPGNSGGPLLDIKGHVIGINTAGMSNGVGFAISSNIINKELPTLIKNGNYTHSYLGLMGSTLTSDLTEHFKGMPKSFRGVFISTIVKNASADKAGLRGMTIDYYGQKHGGDIITSINKQNMTKIDQLITYIDQHTRPGDTITLTVYRDGHYIHLKAKVMVRPGSQIIHNVPYQKHP